MHLLFLLTELLDVDLGVPQVAVVLTDLITRLVRATQDVHLHAGTIEVKLNPESFDGEYFFRDEIIKGTMSSSLESFLDEDNPFSEVRLTRLVVIVKSELGFLVNLDVVSAACLIILSGTIEVSASQSVEMQSRDNFVALSDLVLREKRNGLVVITEQLCNCQQGLHVNFEQLDVEWVVQLAQFILLIFFKAPVSYDFFSEDREVACDVCGDRVDFNFFRLFFSA